MVISLVYASIATRDLHAGELIELLDAARSWNAAAGVTGLLVLADGSFLQVLEGSAEAVDTLFAEISRDERHTEVRVLSRTEVTEREFDGWSMGFADPEPRWLAEHLPGYVPAEQAPFSRADLTGDGTAARRLLLLLRPGGRPAST